MSDPMDKPSQAEGDLGDDGVSNPPPEDDQVSGTLEPTDDDSATPVDDRS